ncbi:DNA gyrase inhibitor YacG [Allosphingosinicella flava]|uniref:DNA gyrase inhibitor YacG n=1 Tax=Allosphingosinicella flava TaxID=2771430 RepID=A0A7T2GJ19_9SPHN|nr:DNA gyrase inhibitor YacG [Sphingosinicella flava]QPQ54438.1 DNA gyrase inhibitor YacG [Sphingosinicella flava]
MSTASTPDRTRAVCPLCRKPESADHAPFCSRGCKDRDLLNWLGEGYRVPGLPAEPASGDFEEK